MSEKYKKFAKETLDMITLAASMVRQDNNGKPLLIISAGSPKDQPIEDVKNFLKRQWNEKAAAKEEPSMASAYAHIASIKAAEQLFGKQNVLVSFGCSPDDVKKILGDTKNGKLGDTLEKVFHPGNPAIAAFRYAHERGFTITGSDTGKETAIERAKDKGDMSGSVLDETRYATERNAINMMGKVKTGAVVHITGIQHLPVLIGMKYGENPDYDDAPPNPYEEIYGLPLLINSDDRNSPVFKSLTVPEFGLLQIDAPGRMDESDISDIGKRIDEAANPLSPSPAPAPAPTSPPRKFSA